MTAPEIAAVPDPDPVFDLDACIAERAPARPFTFRFDGDLYTLPARPDMLAAAAMEGERLDEGFRMLLGTEQYARIQASEKVFDDEALVAMMGAYTKHIGENLGESEASATSSRNTVKR